MSLAETTSLQLGRRPAVAAISLGAGLALIVFLHLVLSDAAADFLIDRTRDSYPFTVQNVMWLVFAVGIGELVLRLREALAEIRQLSANYLPEDERSMLGAEDLSPLYRAMKHAPESDQRFLPRLIRRVVLQFQTSKSIDQANSLLNSSLELYLHEIDLRYSMLRYIMWLIPTLGFIGTVIGIALALGYTGSADISDPNLLPETTKRLAVAFNTTLLALIQSALLVFGIHFVQAREERALNRAGQYCLDNLINRLYER